jgi:SAM-dependent methyltransferase
VTSRSKLFSLGFLTLFLELVLIRYLAGNVWNLGYFPNLVLIAAFVGIGIGFAFHHLVGDAASEPLFAASAMVVGLLVGVVTRLHPVVPGFVGGQAQLGGELFFTATPGAGAGLGNAALFALWFMMTAAAFALLSQRTAKLFRQFPPLTAYTLDIAGSCSGVLAFMGASWLQLPAALWFLALAVLYVCAAGGRARSWGRLLPAGALGAAALLAAHQDTRLLAAPETAGELIVRWSPYQKVEYSHEPGGRPRIYVNGVLHQYMASDRKGELKSDIPYTVPHKERRRAGLPPYAEVLVLGAGSGNDVAAALRSGATHVDALEIDPVIADLGRRHHPAHPYQDARVSLIVDDGRAFMTRARGRYDLIVFALTDSIVKVSPMAQLRLENYLFTEEALRSAWRLLKADGDLVFYNFYRQPWLPAKIERMVHDVSGRYPRRLYEEQDFVILAAGAHNSSPTPPALASGVDVATDDWPFPYLRQRGIPAVYLAAMCILGVAVSGIAALQQRSTAALSQPSVRRSAKLAFLLMGASFLLLETKSVIQFSLLFGTTWLNNSLVFLAVLLLVLAANWVALGLPRRSLGAVFAALILSCGVGWAWPLSSLLAIGSPLLRFAAAAPLTFAPIFFANLMFSVAFGEQPAPEHVFGWNLMGATLGGISEYASLAIGYRALALLVAACYAVAFGCLMVSRRQSRSFELPFPLVGKG